VETHKTHAFQDLEIEAGSEEVRQKGETEVKKRQWRMGKKVGGNPQRVGWE